MLTSARVPACYSDEGGQRSKDGMVPVVSGQRQGHDDDPRDEGVSCA
jgi:hypothetical protein